jgi:hypothetical protein
LAFVTSRTSGIKLIKNEELRMKNTVAIFCFCILLSVLKANGQSTYTEPLYFFDTTAFHNYLTSSVRDTDKVISKNRRHIVQVFVTVVEALKTQHDYNCTLAMSIQSLENMLMNILIPDILSLI